MIDIVVGGSVARRGRQKDSLESKVSPYEGLSEIFNYFPCF